MFGTDNIGHNPNKCICHYMSLLYVTVFIKRQQKGSRAKLLLLLFLKKNILGQQEETIIDNIGNSLLK